jgi:hypothetical protein
MDFPCVEDSLSAFPSRPLASTRVRTGARLLPPSLPPDLPPPPHASCRVDHLWIKGARLRAALGRRPRRSPGAGRFNHVSLIEMHRDNRMYEWRTIEAVPLGQPA